MLTAKRLRRVILDQAHRAHEGHIGSALSIAEILTVLYRDILPPLNSGDRSDCVVLSKGHAALALYAALHLSGRLTSSQIADYCTDGSRIGIHPQHGLPGVEFTTGSLGQGVSFACGCALADRLRGEEWQTYAICSDAECDEGSTWEAAMLAAQRNLGNLTVIIDYNRQQALGSTDSIISLGDLRSRWEAFGWDAVDVNGHSETEIRDALIGARHQRLQPHVIVANTRFGKGVAFMEGQLKWHYASMTDEEHGLAVAMLENQP